MTTSIEHHPSTRPPLSDETTKKLRQQLDTSMTKTRPGARGRTFTFIPTHIAISIANEIFGPGNWSRTVKEITRDTDAQGQVIGYSALVSLHIHENGAVYEDIGYQSMTETTIRERGQPDRKVIIQTADEHDRCRKSAVSDGLKRCLRHAGPMFGNELYADEEDRKRLANGAIDAWVKAGYSEDEAYDIVVEPPYRKTFEVPISKSIAHIAQARNYLEQNGAGRHLDDDSQTSRNGSR